MKHITALTSWTLLAGATLTSPAQALAQGNYKNFRVAMYVLRGDVTRWSNHDPPPLLPRLHHAELTALFFYQPYER